MELKQDLYFAVSKGKMDKLDEVIINLLEHLNKAGYKDDLIWSYMFHKISRIILTSIFERFPKDSQEVQRKEMLIDHFKTFRKIYNKKYTDIDQSIRSLRNAKRKRKYILPR